MHYQKRRKEGALFWTYFSTKKNAKFFGGFRSLVVACCAPEYKDMKKKTEKRTQKTLYFTLPKTYWVSPKLQKSDDDDDERGTVHTRPIDRRPPREETLVFLTRARERERERRFPPRVSLSNAPDSSSHPFSSPPNTSSVGFKFSIETPTTLPVAVAR